ncbi:MAG: glycosyltransferase family 4 protein [Candidatus Aenigmatarchaeota archaeon]
MPQKDIKKFSRISKKYKIAIIGHSVLEIRQQLFIKKLKKYFNLSLHVPQDSQNIILKDSRVKIFKYKSIFPKRQQICFMFNLCKNLKKENPDYVIVWAEPWYFISQELNLSYPKNRIHFVFENLKKPKNPIFKIIEKISFRKTNILVAASETSKKIYRIKGYNGIIKVFPMVGIDTKKFRKFNEKKRLQLKRKYNLENKKVVLFAGRLIKEKGISYILQAFLVVNKKIKNSVLLFAGEGPEKKTIEKFSKKYNLQKNIILLGKIDYLKMPQIYNLADVFVYPSIATRKWAEQFGYSMIEASLCGVPVIATNSGSIPEILKIGIIIPEKNSDALSKAIINLLLNKKIYKKMSKNGAKFYKKYDIDNIVKKYLCLVNKRVKYKLNSK